METFDSFLYQLEEASSPEVVKKMGNSPILEDHELARASYALLCKHFSLPLPSIKFEQSDSGAVPLFKRAFFPWGGLPYPKEHAHLAALLFQLGEKEIAEKMARWQLATLDHNQKPIFSLFLQEGTSSYQELELANQTLFSLFPYDFEFEKTFLDNENALIRYQTHDATILSTGVGCKSGMGVFLYKQIGIVNYAPQFFPLTEYAGFGLAGRPLQFRASCIPEGYDLNYLTRLAAPPPYETGIGGLQGSGYSGLWISVKQECRSSSLQTECLFEGTRPIEGLSFTLFVKGDACVVARTHRLKPRSLDRYQGPPQQIGLYGKDGKVEISEFAGLSKMEIIPLAGDNSFWGADFLIAFTVADPKINLAFTFGEL